MQSVSRLILCGVIAACLLLPVSTHAADGKLNRAYDRVIKTGTLRCGYTSFPPIVFLIDPNKKSFTGFVPEYMAQLGKNLSLKIEYVEDAGFGPQAIEGLKAGRFDAYCTGLNINAPRGREVSFTNPIFYSPVYVYARADDKRFDKDVGILNDAKYTLSTMDGEATDGIAKSTFPLAKTFSLPQNSEMSLLYNNVAQKKADAVFSDAPQAEEFMKNNPGLLHRVNDTPVLTYTVAIAVDNNEPKLRDMLNAALTEMQANGQIKNAVKKYDPQMTGYKTPEFSFAAP